jgi:hypothetical protein
MQRNIFKASFLLVFLSIWACKSTQVATTHLTPAQSQSERKQLVEDITYLASDELEGRETGTEGERLAADYLLTRFKAIGLKGIFTGKEPYFQYFQKTIKSNPHADKPNPDDPVIIGKNVGAFLDKGKAHTIIIGAHYDHLGYGKEGSLYTGPPAIHNGADDNASGVAAMLLLANYFKDKDLNNNLLFLAFSGEEKGLWGSNFFVDNSPLSMGDINFMINMDMVGRLNEDRQLAIYGTGTSPSWPRLMKSVRYPVFKQTINESGMGPSDHTSFYLEDMPVLHFFTGQHEDYHRPTDDTHKINFDGIMDITNYISSIVTNADQLKKLKFTKTKDEQQQAPDFKVTLGVIPDYLFDGKGMRIDGVREGRTADVAGLKKGDVVVKMGDLEIVDMMSYMKALGAFEPGQSTQVTIVREGDMMMHKEVTFQ